MCRRESRSGFLWAGAGPPLGQQPGPSAAPTLAWASSTCSYPMGTAGRDGAGAPVSPARGQGPKAGGWTVTEAAARARVGSINPAVAAAGASITPTLQTGQQAQLLLGSGRVPARNGRASRSWPVCRLPNTCLPSGASHRLPPGDPAPWLWVRAWQGGLRHGLVEVRHTLRGLGLLTVAPPSSLLGFHWAPSCASPSKASAVASFVGE